MPPNFIYSGRKYLVNRLYISLIGVFISVRLCSRLKRFVIIILDSIRNKNMNAVNIHPPIHFHWTSFLIVSTNGTTYLKYNKKSHSYLPAVKNFLSFSRDMTCCDISYQIMWSAHVHAVKWCLHWCLDELFAADAESLSFCMKEICFKSAV